MATERGEVFRDAGPVRNAAQGQNGAGGLPHVAPKFLQAVDQEQGRDPSIGEHQGDAVPRFYFDVREGSRFLPDEEGLEFANLDAAERAAVSAARIGQDLLSKGNAHKVIVEVRNPRGKRVLAVTVTMQVERVAPRA
jgi:hypothetical protein